MNKLMIFIPKDTTLRVDKQRPISLKRMVDFNCTKAFSLFLKSSYGCSHLRNRENALFHWNKTKNHINFISPKDQMRAQFFGTLE